MPALIFVILLAVLFAAIPGTVLVPLFFAALILSPLSEVTLGFARATHLEGFWAAGITLGIVALVIVVIASFFAWKARSVPARRRLYLNLTILTVGVPAAVAFGTATTPFPH